GRPGRADQETVEVLLVAAPYRVLVVTPVDGGERKVKRCGSVRIKSHHGARRTGQWARARGRVVNALVVIRHRRLRDEVGGVKRTAGSLARLAQQALAIGREVP